MNNLKKSIWFFDIDDTLIDTAGVNEIASEGIVEALEEKYGNEKSERIKVQFNKIFNTILAGYRLNKDSANANNQELLDESNSLLEKVANSQKLVIKEWGKYKKWSREVFIKLAMDKVGVEPRKAYVEGAAESYWKELTAKVSFFSGAIDLNTRLVKNNRPIFLITSSDARLQMRDDGQFLYKPEYSKKMKTKRIEQLRRRGLEYQGLSIGDPEDKPTIEFFKKAISLAENCLSKNLDLKNSVIVGDSYEGDLETPFTKMGFGMAILVRKNQTKLIKESDNLYSVGNLMDILKIFSES
ncbi:hypothetical protein GF362_03740 [Candidatus Dojkabacteria bacterium]|nr:hypothetical protein [Candidatus Dojkabacteria bacterium]